MASTDKTSTAAVEETAKFIPVDPKPGEILVLVGYLLMRLTNKRWKNTVHRVLEPPCSADSGETRNATDDSQQMASERYSIAFFAHPDLEATIEPLASCCVDQQPAFRPIHVGEYLRKKMVQIRS